MCSLLLRGYSYDGCAYLISLVCLDRTFSFGFLQFRANGDAAHAIKSRHDKGTPILCNIPLVPLFFFFSSHHSFFITLTLTTQQDTMTTYFKTTARNYTDVTVTPEGINTDEFLQATEGLVKIFGIFSFLVHAVIWFLIRQATISFFMVKRN